MITLGRFKASNELLTQEEFLHSHKTPFLLTSTLEEEEATFTTAKWIAGSPAPVVGPKILLPVEKQPDRNSFPLMITLGRALNNDIIVADSRVSSFHAFFRESGGTWSVFDAKSENGTRIDDGSPLASDEGAELRRGTLITLGRALVLEFLDPQGLYERLRVH